MTLFAPMALLLVLTASVSPPEEISFCTDDRGIVYAHEYGTGDHAVVLAHGGRFTKESWEDQAPVIAGTGFRVLAIDFRGRGKSKGGPRAVRGLEHLDVIAAARDNWSCSRARPRPSSSSERIRVRPCCLRVCAS